MNRSFKARAALALSVSAIAATLALTSSRAPAQDAPKPAASAAPDVSLAQVYKDDFLIGTAFDFLGNNSITEKEQGIIKRQYNIITPENSMKPESVHPQPNEWTFETSDRLVSFAHENNMQIWGHTLVWHAQTPRWFFEGENGQPVTKEVAIQRLKDHIFGVVGHFKGKLRGIDVVNEAIADGGGDGSTENLRRSPWLTAIGPEFLTLAFKFAHEADPNLELYYNDYNIERGAKHKSSLVLLKRLKDEGAPITGVGIQGHWGLGNNLPYEEIDQAIADYAALGLKVSITELDVLVGGGGGGQLNGPVGQGGPNGRPATRPGGQGGPGAQGAPGGFGGPGGATRPAGAQGGPGGQGGRRGLGGGGATRPAGDFGVAGVGQGGGQGGPARGPRGPQTPATPEQLERQAEAYAKLFAIFLKHKGTIERVTFWGINDARSWRQGQHGLIYDGNNEPKPAFTAIVNAKTK